MFLHGGKMYRVLWSKNDHPSGWLEITNACQLKCKGCYRECDVYDRNDHVPLEILKGDADRYITERNISMINLSGGEPLLYPYFFELVDYLKSKKLKIRVVTNGILLNEQSLVEYNKHGIDDFLVHISAEQGNGIISESVLKPQREKICNLFRKIKGSQLGFIMPITIETFPDFRDLLVFFKENVDIIRSLVFTGYNAQANEKYDQHRKIATSELAKVISEVYECNPSAFMGKRYDMHRPAWMWWFPLIGSKNKKIFGNITPSKFEKIQMMYKRKTGKWSAFMIKKPLKKKSLFYLLDIDEFLPSLFEDVYLQVISLLEGPEFDNGKWNTCEGCLDPVYFNNNLVPSCLLERIKKGENIKL